MNAEQTDKNIFTLFLPYFFDLIIFVFYSYYKYRNWYDYS